MNDFTDGLAGMEIDYRGAVTGETGTVAGYVANGYYDSYDIESLPEGWHAYFIRHGDESDDNPVSLEDLGGFVNHYGDLITQTPLEQLLMRNRENAEDHGTLEVTDWNIIW